MPVAPWLIFEIEIDPAGMNRLKNVQTLACPLLTVTLTEPPCKACRSPLQLTDTALQCPDSESGAFSLISYSPGSRESSEGAAVAGTPGSVVVAVTWCVPWPDDLTS